MQRNKLVQFIAAVAVVGTIILAPAAAAQGLKIGFIQDEEIKAGYKAWQKAQDQWQIDSKAWEDEAIQKQAEIDELKVDYDRQKVILSEEKRKERIAAIGAKEESLDAFTRQVFGPQGTAERKQKELIQPLLEKITRAIEAVAIDGSFDVIFTLQSGLGYIKESYDVTDKILAYLDANTE